MVILTHLIAVAVGALVGYFVLRNNPKYKAYLDSVAEKLDQRE